MTEWLRKDSAELALVAQQAGLTPGDAERALVIGARFIAVGLTETEIGHMWHDYWTAYREAHERWLK